MGRAPCCDKNNGMKRGPWTPEEDQKLLDYINKNGYGNWRTLPKNAGLERCGKSCRLRWTNYLRPDIKRGRFTFEEEEAIIQLHSVLGNKWSAIAANLPGRTDNEIKNYWNTHIKKRLLRMGIDPVTHTPHLDFLDLSSILASSSLYNTSSQLNTNISRLLGALPHLINPAELLRLATSIFSSTKKNDAQNVQENQLYNLDHNHCQVENNLVQLSQPSQIQTPFQEIPFSNDHFVSNFSSQNCQLNDWQCNEIMMPTNVDGVYNHISSHGYGNCGSGQSVMENLDFTCNNNIFSFPSILSNLSTPSSSLTPLNSNSPQINSCGASEDERESYASSMWKYEFPNVLDISGFI